MDDSRIFCKTPSGEEAVRERTRLVQRNLRTVLIIVDGHADVAELKRKAGDAARVDATLAELEVLGLIECLDAPLAPLEPAEVPAADSDFVDIFDEIPSAATGGDDLLMDEQGTEPAQVRVVPGFADPMADVPMAAEKPSRPSLLEEVSAGWRRFLRRRSGAKKAKKVAEPLHDEGDEPATVRKVRRRYHIRMSAWIAGGLLGSAALAVLVVLLFPYGSYRPDVEQWLSKALRDTVRVGSLGVRFTPFPNVTLNQVTVGTDGYASAASVRLLPELSFLFGGHKRLREVHVEGVRLSQAGIERATRWLPAEALRNVTVGRLTLEDVSVDFGQASAGGLSGEGVIDPERGLVKWSLRNRESTLRMEVSPGKTAAEISASATSWKTPFQPALVFDALTVQGELSAGRFRFGKLDGRLYDGLVEGAGALAWGEGARFEGDLEFKRLAADRLLAVLSGEPAIEGVASGRLRLEAQAPTLAGLSAAVRMAGNFGIAQGVLRRIDLAETIRVRAPVRGGATRFEQFSGSFAADGRGVRLTDLQLASGLMRASGQVTVTAEGKISGSVAAEMRGSAHAVRAGMAITGSVADPELKSRR
ncbi:MAG: AsmA-like C-terminal region-containing protein [Rhodocyclaceae bacterium]|nr:AsmA-like C-terminal region-containing protein [Rhodocyclaceae bacterium]